MSLNVHIFPVCCISRGLKVSRLGGFEEMNLFLPSKSRLPWSTGVATTMELGKTQSNEANQVIERFLTTNIRR